MKTKFFCFYNELTIVSWLEAVQGIFIHIPSGFALMAIKSLFMVQSTISHAVVYKCCPSECLLLPMCITRAGLATIKGSILWDHILPSAEGKKNGDSEKSYKLTGGPPGFTNLLFSFLPSLANACHWKTSHSDWCLVLPTLVHAAQWEVPFPCGSRETYV